MAMVLASGFGSIVARELGQLALEHSPMLQQAAKSAVVEVAKKSFDLVLSNNPRFASFLSQFGITKFHQQNHKTFSNRGRKKHLVRR
jgi:hypothetical protein